MCAIWGQINAPETDTAWNQQQLDKALLRGKDPSGIFGRGYALHHTRLATNQSPDQYPITVEAFTGAMNGIVAEKRFKELKERFTLNYTVDTAYLFKLVIEDGWAALDDTDFVFALWVKVGNLIFLANKDFPLFIKQQDELWFSSFKAEGFEPLGNRVIECDLDTASVTEIYKYTNLVYQQ